MEFKTIKPVFGAVLMLSAIIFASNTIAADAVIVSGADAQSTTFPDKDDGTVEKNHMHMAKVMDKNDAQVALTINKNLSLDVLGVRAGKRVEPCEKEKGNDCHFDRSKVFSEEKLTITVVEGSCCAYISTGNDTYEFCPPEWPLEFVNSISGKTCPLYE